MMTNKYDTILQLIDKVSLEREGYDRLLDIVNYAHAILDRMDNLDLSPSTAFPDALVDSIQNRISVLCDCEFQEATEYLDTIADFLNYKPENLDFELEDEMSLPLLLVPKSSDS